MRWMRRVLGSLIALLIAIGIAIPAATFLAPAFGHQLFAIRGSSMSPAIPLGALIAVAERPLSDVRVGDIVTWRADNGVWITHRVIELLEEGGEPLIRTQGDANATPDAVAVPARALVGIVDAWVPLGGFAMTLLSTPSGLVSWLSFGLALLTLEAFLADGPTTASGRPTSRRTTGWPIHYEGVTVRGDGDLALLDDMLRCSEGDHRSCVTDVRPRACAIAQPDAVGAAA